MTKLYGIEVKAIVCDFCAKKYPGNMATYSIKWDDKQCASVKVANVFDVTIHNTSTNEGIVIHMCRECYDGWVKKLEGLYPVGRELQ